MGPVIIMMGSPGAGKGTQSDILASRLGGVHVSTGDILRATPDPKLRAIIDHGELIDSADLIRIMEGEFSKVPAEKAIVFDGGSRKLGEAEYWVRRFPEMGRELKCVVYLNVGQDEATARNLKRGRHDDTPEAQTVRWEAYRRDTEPALNYYRSKGLLKEVDGSGTPEEVAARVAQAVT